MLALLRQSGDVGVLDTVWAEDGTVFLRGALWNPLLETVGRGYAGYLHLAPRLAAEVVTLFPSVHAATLLAVAAAVMAACCGGLVYLGTAGHLGDRRLRLFLGALVVLQPLMAIETLNAIAPAQWPLTFAAFWMALWRPPGWPASVLAGLVLGVTIMSAPLAFALLPILALRVLVVRDMRSWAVVVPFLAGGALQAAAMVTQPAPNAAGGTVDELLAIWAEVVATSAVVGVDLALFLRGLAGGWLEFATVAVVASVVALAVRGRHPLTAILATLASLVLFTGTVWARGALERMLAATAGGNLPDSTRFAVVPVLLLCTVLVLALDAAPPRGWSWWGGLRVAAVAAVILVAGVDYLMVNGRSWGPSWSDQIARGVASCRVGAGEAALQVASRSGPAQRLDRRR